MLPLASDSRFTTTTSVWPSWLPTWDDPDLWLGISWDAWCTIMFQILNYHVAFPDDLVPTQLTMERSRTVRRTFVFRLVKIRMNVQGTFPIWLFITFLERSPRTMSKPRGNQQQTMYHYSFPFVHLNLQLISLDYCDIFLLCDPI